MESSEARQPISPADYSAFYDALFASLHPEYGHPDPLTLTSIVGFDCGGPVSLNTFGRGQGAPITTYVTCELAVRDDQVPSDSGCFELLVTTNDEAWARDVIDSIAGMSLAATFGLGHTVDVGPSVAKDHPLQGVFFDFPVTFEFGGFTHAVFPLIGMFRAEMEFVRAHGVEALKQRLIAAGIHPRSIANRTSVV